MPRPREVPREGVPLVKVRAKNETIAKYIKHPKGTRFRDGVADWPMDGFTQRRIRDGDVTVEATPRQSGRAAPHREARHET